MSTIKKFHPKIKYIRTLNLDSTWIIHLDYATPVFLFNPFSTNVPLMWKPGSWFLLEIILKQHVTSYLNWKSPDLLNRTSQYYF